MFSLKVQQLAISYGLKTVFNRLSLTHTEGILGISGANGSGKSSLLKCIAGLLQPTSGTVTWKKANTKIPKERLTRYMGFAAPYISLYSELTTRENLLFLARLRKQVVKAEDLTSVFNFLALSEVAEQPYGKLSTGQQQRARLASSLLHSPPLLLLDEPGSNLDKQGTDIIKNVIGTYRKESHIVILASNDKRELNLCDRIISVEQ